ncbi:MAG: crossover junction endodeoxyribonuclease RuvC [Chloroflexota bacterium]|nr:crossover junction endodeoxyribonuclease RuvC [Chloroflexota bacterium]
MSRDFQTVSSAWPMRIMGIDPGLSVTGYSILEFLSGTDKPNLLTADKITTDSKTPLGARLGKIHKMLEFVIKEYTPAEVAVESQFLGKNVKSAMSVSQVKAIALLAASQNGLSGREISPREVKEIVAGWGGADKEQVRAMVLAQINAVSLPASLDISDATAICLAAFSLRRFDIIMGDDYGSGDES